MFIRRNYLLLTVLMIALFAFSGCGDDEVTTVGSTGGNGNVNQLPSDNALNPVLIPAGTFQMGQAGLEEPVHQVTVSKDFYMGKYEVTNGEYVKFLNAQTSIALNWVTVDSSDNRCGLAGNIGNPSGITVKSGYEIRPVVYVSWFGAVAYCNWLSTQYGFTSVYGADPESENPAVWITKNGYRLPTEAEWEYACRARTVSIFYWGDDTSSTPIIDNYAWYSDNSGGHNQNIGMKLPNNFGLYDMSGNVWEWCNDWSDDYTSGSVTNPTGPSKGSDRLVRGGSWDFDTYGCQSSFRFDGGPGYRTKDIGFRLVRTK